MARPALQPAGRRRAARERADGPALQGQRRRHDRDPGPGGRREDALLAQHDDRDPGRGRDRDAARRDARLRVGRGHRQRVPARPGSFRLSSTTVTGAPALTDYGSNLRQPDGRPQHDATTARRAARACSAPARSSGRGGSTRTTIAAARAADARMQQATVNLFADMGAQPVDAAVRRSSPRRRRPTRPRRPRRSPSPANGASVTARPADHDQRHGDRRRRRPGRRRRGLDERRRDLAPRERPRRVDVRVDARLAVELHDPQPRGRRQRQPGEPRARRRPSPRAAATAPARAASGARRRRRRRPPRRPTPCRSRSASRFRSSTATAGSPASASTRAARTPGTHVGHLWSRDRHAARDRDVHERDRDAAGSRSASARPSTSRPTRPTSPPTTRRAATTRATSTTSRSPASTTAPLRALADGEDAGGNGVYALRRERQLPERDLARGELLGRRRVRDRRRRARHHAAHGHRRDAGARRDRASRPARTPPRSSARR